MPREAPIPACDPLSAGELRAIDAYWRACNYLAADMIYLPANPLLRKPLEPQHGKEKLRDQGIDCRNYAHRYGVDAPEQRDWTWPSDAAAGVAPVGGDGLGTPSRGCA